MRVNAEPGCTCPPIAETMKAALAGRELRSTCTTHDLEAAKQAAGVEEAEARARALDAAADVVRQRHQPQLEQPETIKVTMHRAIGAMSIPLNDDAALARSAGLPVPNSHRSQT